MAFLFLDWAFPLSLCFQCYVFLKIGCGSNCSTPQVSTRGLESQISDTLPTIYSKSKYVKVLK